MSTLPYLPMEIWEDILDLFDRSSLLNFQNVCRNWYDVLIQYVMNGRLKSRALVSCYSYEIFLFVLKAYLH